MKRRLRELLSDLNIMRGNGLQVGMSNQLNREEWLNQSLQAIAAGSRILDAGAGELQYKRFCSHLRYVSQDFAKYDGKGNTHGLQTGSWDQGKLDIVSDITAIPEENASFDAVMCIEVLEHIPDPISALREFSRLLRNNGTLILTAPFCSLTHFAPYHYSTGFSRYFFEKWLPEIGFEIGEIAFNGNYFEYLAQEIRRIPSMRSQYTSFVRDGFWKRFLNQTAERIMLRQLQEASLTDKGSSGTLSFGLHIMAVRKRSQKI